MSRLEVAGDINWRRPRPAQGCRADDEEEINNVNNVVSRSGIDWGLTLSKKREQFRKCQVHGIFLVATQSENYVKYLVQLCRSWPVATCYIG
jgi:3-methyladenine DNA glycosylase Tag